MRQKDIDDLNAWGFRETHIEHFFKHALDSQFSYSVCNGDGEPVCITGCTKYWPEEDTSVCWMACTDKISSAKFQLVRASKSLIKGSKPTWSKQKIFFDTRKGSDRKLLDFAGYKPVREFLLNGIIFIEMVSE